MLLEFVHELGHNANGPHTHCVALDAAEQTAYGVPGRSFVDLCFSGEGGCYSGTTSAPSEKGTVMSYCHNITVGGFRASRYLMGSTAPNEPSAKVLPFFKTELEADTPNGTITTQAEPIACSAGRTASVAACAGCTITWGITGGMITAGQGTTSMTFTPTGTSVALTATQVKTNGCGITTSKTVATACAALAPPTNVLATATTSTNVLVTWTTSGATSYNVYRTPNGTTTPYTQVATGVVGTSYNDPASPGTGYLYKVRSVSGTESGDSNVDYAITFSFTDPALSAGVTLIKAVHITELRTAVNLVRAAAGIGAGAFGETITAGVTPARASHIDELRQFLDFARINANVGKSAAVYSRPTLTPGSTVITIADITELRAATQ